MYFLDWHGPWTPVRYANGIPVLPFNRPNDLSLVYCRQHTSVWCSWWLTCASAPHYSRENVKPAFSKLKWCMEPAPVSCAFAWPVNALASWLSRSFTRRASSYATADVTIRPKQRKWVRFVVFNLSTSSVEI